VDVYRMLSCRHFAGLGVRNACERPIDIILHVLYGKFASPVELTIPPTIRMLKSQNCQEKLGTIVFA